MPQRFLFIVVECSKSDLGHASRIAEAATQ
jgi:hypothetical protein